MTQHPTKLTIKKEIIKDIFWLLDCEEDCIKTNTNKEEALKTIENIRKRIKGHFNL